MEKEKERMDETIWRLVNQIFEVSFFLAMFIGVSFDYSFYLERKKSKLN